jgi:Leucine-rich repeat (LRR) protein
LSTPHRCNHFSNLLVYPIPADNNLVGTIPSELSHLKWLNSLDLESNRLGGSIPSEVGLLTNLEFLALNNNKLQGEIPKTLAT